MLGLMFGGSKRSGPRALEEDIIAVALLGDVEINLCDARITSREITIHAWAIVNDVEVIIPEGVAVDLSGVAVKGDLENWVTPASPDTSRFVVKIQGHAVLGDVEVRRPWPKKAVRGWRRRSIES
jgi:predicted membrane protein